MTPSHGSDAEILPADRPAELDHAPDDRARDDDVVHRHVLFRAGQRLDRGQLRDEVLAAERALEPRLEIVRADRREEADRAVVDADHRRPGAERALQRAQHRPVAAEHDDEVGRSEVAVRRTVVLLGLVLRIDELDAALARDALEAFERLADRLRVTVRDDRRSANGLS